VAEMKSASDFIIQMVQKKLFAEEIKAVSANKQPVGLVNLNPILQDGILRVGGRLRNGEFSDIKKHPAIMPGNHPVTELLLRDYHASSGHAGVEHTLALSRDSYWILKGRRAVKHYIGRCLVCRKRDGQPIQQKMADLPSERLQPNQPPFNATGVDCFGPFTVKRGRTDVKVYGCIFICLATGAIHIEVLQKMETDSFINGLRRFISRRGKPEVMLSDNGTNFVGGEKELRKSLDDWNRQVSDYLLQHNIQWNFNPPHASNFGGIWERQIRAVRRALDGLTQERHRLSDEGLHTLMCEVEAILNSRPVTPVSDDSTDLEALTPNHLLLGRRYAQLPPGQFGNEDIYKRMWRQVQHLANVFWSRWMKEYIPMLQKRQKWHTRKYNIKQDDFVMLVDENSPRNQWITGRIIEVHTGKDGLVRSAIIKTRSGSYTRPVNKIVLLEKADIY
jgi:hypothetical protein